MSSTILKGRLEKVEIGISSGGSHSDITNLVYARWNRVHDIRPAFVSATKVPDHFVQPHSWIVWEVGMLGRNTAWSTQDVQVGAGTQLAYVEGGGVEAGAPIDNAMMDYFRIFYYSTVDVSKYTDFSGGLVSTEEISFQDTEDIIVVMRGLAKYKTDG